MHPQKSNRYNPFAHIHNDADVLSMVNSLFTFNINGIKPNSVFDMAERKLLTAFFFMYWTNTKNSQIGKILHI